jgi:hypothetical protein
LPRFACPSSVVAQPPPCFMLGFPTFAPDRNGQFWRVLELREPRGGD